MTPLCVSPLPLRGFLGSHPSWPGPPSPPYLPAASGSGTRNALCSPTPARVTESWGKNAAAPGQEKLLSCKSEAPGGVRSPPTCWGLFCGRKRPQRAGGSGLWGVAWSAARGTRGRRRGGGGACDSGRAGPSLLRAHWGLLSPALKGPGGPVRASVQLRSAQAVEGLGETQGIWKW